MIRFAMGAAALAALSSSAASVACAPHGSVTHGSATSDAATLAVGPHAEGDHFTVDAAQVGSCAADTECKLAIQMTATSGFHINVDYPHKFTAVDTAGVEFLGKDPAKKNVFSKGAGDFVEDTPTSGTLTVRFKPHAGSPTIQGTLKLGVCSDQNCMLPQVDLAVPVTVK